MRSPFPGMDPYLEPFWGDVHHTMIVRASDAIQKQLPRDLVARIDVREFIEPIESWPRVEAEWFQRRGGSLEGSEPERQGFIQILDRSSGRRVVTLIEILKPAKNSHGAARDLYVKKQGELKAAGASLVEIDLLRPGTRVLSASFDLSPDGHRTPYAACVNRGWKPFEFEYYPIPLRERLPAIAVPLRQADDDVALDLQAVLNECCEEGRYVEDIDYSQQPDPPLEGDDISWVDALLREQGRR